MREQRVRAAGAVSNNDIKIAVLEEQMRTMQKHLENIEKQIESHMRTSADQNAKIMETLNKGKGAFAASLIAAGGVGSLIMLIANWLMSKIQGWH